MTIVAVMVTFGSMQLKAYLSSGKVGITEFAGRVGVHRQTMWRIVTGRRTPTREVIRKIELASEGQVTRADLMPDVLQFLAEHPAQASIVSAAPAEVAA